jgi:WD40 repeat protein
MDRIEDQHESLCGGLSMSGKQEPGVRRGSREVKTGQWLILLVGGILLIVGGTRYGLADGPAEQMPEPSSRADAYGDPLPAKAIARLGSTRLRPGGWIDSLVFSTDGKLLCSTGYHGVFTWEAATGRLLRRFRTAQEDVSHLTLSADDKTIAALCGKDTIRLWSAGDGRELRTLPAHEVHALALAPDGSLLAWCGPDQRVRLWDVTAGTERLALPPHGHYLHWLCFAEDGRSLFTAGWDGLIARWEAATGRGLHQIGGRDNWAGKPCVSVVALSKDGSTVATCDPSNEEVVRLWDFATGKELRQLSAPKHDLTCLAFTPDGKVLATAGSTGPIRLWEVTTGKELRQIKDRALAARAVAFSPDASRLATAGADGVVQLWETATGKPWLRGEAHEGPVSALAYTRDGRFLATGGGADGMLRLWDARTGGSVRALGGHDAAVQCLDVSPDGRTVVSGSPDGTIRFWDLENGRELRRVVVRGERKALYIVDGLRLSRDGRTLTSVSQERFDFAGFGSTLIQVWDTETARALRQLPEHSGPHLRPELVALAPHGGTVALSELELQRGKVTPYVGVQDVAGGKTLAALHLDADGRPMAFSPDGKVLVTQTSRRTEEAGRERWESSLWLWEAATGRALFDVRYPADIQAAAFSPDGSVLAAAGPQAIVLWEVATGKMLSQFAGPGVPVAMLRFAPDGRTLATGQADSTAVVWDLGRVIWGDGAPAPASAAPLSGLWADLADDDAPRAYRAVWSLAAVPDRALPFLEERLTPATDEDLRRFPQLLADLDSEQFAVREEAQRALLRMGAEAEPLLRRALAAKPAPEVRRRLQAILAEPVVVRSSDKLRRLRAIQALKLIGSDRARKLLDVLSKGFAAAPETQAAARGME